MKDFEKPSAYQMHDCAGQSADAQGTGCIVWKSGWYAKRLHAVTSDTVFPEGRLGGIKAMCGQFVYREPPTDWARRYAEKAECCKRCERIVSQNTMATK